MRRPHGHILTLALASLLPAACGLAPDAGAPPPDGPASAQAPPSALVRPGDAPGLAAADTAVQAPANATAMPSQADPGAGAGFQRVAVVDASGFEKPMPALWLEIPAGWQGAGNVVWNPQAPCGATPSYQWQAQSPDGRQSLQLLPAEAWAFDNLGMNLPAHGCPRWEIRDVRGYLESLAQRLRPGSRTLDFRTRDDLIRSPALPSDAQTRHWKEGGELLVAYADGKGEVRESLLAVVHFSETRMAGVMPGEVRIFNSGMAGAPVVATAPSGQLDLALATHFATSAQPDPQWQARMDKHNTALAQRGLQGQIERGRISAQTQREVADIQQRGWESRSDSSDAIQRQTIDGINNVDRYTDPVTGNEVQLDNRYDNAWRANDGTYFQSNDPNLNPQVDLGVEAQPMERNE